MQLYTHGTRRIFCGTEMWGFGPVLRNQLCEQLKGLYGGFAEQFFKSNIDERDPQSYTVIRKVYIDERLKSTKYN